MFWAHCGDYQRLWWVMLNPVRTEVLTRTLKHGVPICPSEWLPELIYCSTWKAIFFITHCGFPLFVSPTVPQRVLRNYFCWFLILAVTREITHSLLPNEGKTDPFWSPVPTSQHTDACLTLPVVSGERRAAFRGCLPFAFINLRTISCPWKSQFPVSKGVT